MMATASPTPMPAAIRPLARAATSAAKVADVTSVHPAPERTEKATRPGSAVAHRSGTSARLPWVVSGRTSGVDFSCTVGSFGMRTTGTLNSMAPRGG